MSVATSRIEDAPVQAAETLYQFDESPLLARQRQQESNARSYPRRIPLALKRAKGIYVEDVEGRRFIDCLAGAGTLALESGDDGWRSRREGPYHIAFTFNAIVCISYCVLVLDTRR